MEISKLKAAMVVLALLLTASAAIQAQSFPTKPIKLIVPLAAGGTGDTLARTVAEAMARELGQAVIVDNRPGAGGLVGTEAVQMAPADGYTLLAVSPAHTINPLLHAGKKTYDALKDFDTVTVLANTHQMIVMHPSVPVRSLAELIAYAKKNPDKLSYGSAGAGSASHLNMQLFLTMADIKIVHVPYRGSTQSRQDVMSGQVQLTMDGLLPLQPLIKDGRLIPLGLASSKRAQSNPEIPLIGDVVPGYASDTWYGILAPAGTPKDIIGKLNAVIIRGLKAPATRDRFAALGADIVGNTPAEFRTLLEAEQKTWAKVIRTMGGVAQ